MSDLRTMDELLTELGNAGSRYSRTGHSFDARLIREAKAVLERMNGALEFYRDAWKFKPNKLYGGLEWNPAETLLDDCGNKAKEALEGAMERSAPRTIADCIMDPKTPLVTDKEWEAFDRLNFLRSRGYDYKGGP